MLLESSNRIVTDYVDFAWTFSLSTVLSQENFRWFLSDPWIASFVDSKAAFHLGCPMSRDKSWPVSISGRVPEVRQLNENCHWRAGPLSCWELSLCHTCPWHLPSHTSQGCLEKGSQTHTVSLCTTGYSASSLATPTSFKRGSHCTVVQYCCNSVVLYKR